MRPNTSRMASRATVISKSVCRLVQNSALVPKNWAKRKAVVLVALAIGVPHGGTSCLVGFLLADLYGLI